MPAPSEWIVKQPFSKFFELLHREVTDEPITFVDFPEFLAVITYLIKHARLEEEDGIGGVCVHTRGWHGSARSLAAILDSLGHRSVLLTARFEPTYKAHSHRGNPNPTRGASTLRTYQAAFRRSGQGRASWAHARTPLRVNSVLEGAPSPHRPATPSYGRYCTGPRPRKG